MQSTQSEQTQVVEGSLETTPEADKVGKVNELLGLKPETTVSPEKGEPTDNEQSLSEALAQAEKPSDGGESRKAVKPPKTLAELSERTGISVEDLYTISIPASQDGGENPTLGKLKDLEASESDYAGREIELSERRVKLENEQAASRQDLEIILRSLPPEAIKPEVLERARKEREVMLDREAARVLDVIPEWSEDSAKRTDLAGIGEHLAQYGFDKNHLDQVADHRMLRYMRDNFNRMKLVERALGNVKTVNPAPKTTRTAPVRKTEAVTVTPQSPLTDQLSAIDNLIK